MDKATELAHRIVPLADSEWPMTPEGRAIAVEHAATIIRSALAAEREECAKVADRYRELSCEAADKALERGDIDEQQEHAGDASIAKCIAAAIRGLE